MRLSTRRRAYQPTDPAMKKQNPKDVDSTKKEGYGQRTMLIALSSVGQRRSPGKQQASTKKSNVSS